MRARAVVSGVVALGIVVGGAVVVDRVAVGTARDVAVRELRASFDGVVGEPEVGIGGFPFLTQLLAGKLTHVTGQIEGLTFDGLAVTDVHVDARGVTTSAPYTVDDAALAATIPVASVQEIIARQASIDVDLAVDAGRLVASTSVLGLPVTAAVVPRVDGGGIRVDVAQVTLAGLTVDVADLPGGLADRLRDLTIPVEGLPAGVALTAVTVGPAGVRLTATGADVVLPAELAAL